MSLPPSCPLHPFTMAVRNFHGVIKDDCFAEVADDYSPPCAVDEQIVQLEVTVDDIVRVQELQTRQQTTKP